MCIGLISVRYLPKVGCWVVFIPCALHITICKPTWWRIWISCNISQKSVVGWVYNIFASDMHFILLFASLCDCVSGLACNTSQKVGCSVGYSASSSGEEPHANFVLPIPLQYPSLRFHRGRHACLRACLFFPLYLVWSWENVPSLGAGEESRHQAVDRVPHDGEVLALPPDVSPGYSVDWWCWCGALGVGGGVGGVGVVVVVVGHVGDKSTRARQRRKQEARGGVIIDL